MSNWMYPSYLNNADFKYRHMKIHIMESAVTSTDAKSVFETLIGKSDAIAGVEKLPTVSGNTSATGKAGDISDNIGKASNSIQKIMDRGAKVLHTIILPLPNSFNDSHSHQWSTEKGVLGTLGEYVEGLLGKGIAKAADLASIRKPLVDPGYFQNYLGTDPRTWNFSFDFIPMNVQEARQIYAIIKYLRGYSLPSTSVNHALLLAPHYFKIEFTNKWINDLMGAHDVVLKSIDVNYGEDGYMAQTADGMPKHIKMSLSFAERNMSTFENYFGKN